MNVANLLIIYMSSNTMKKGVPHLHMKTVFGFDGLISVLVLVLVLVGVVVFCSVNFLAFNFSLLRRFLIALPGPFVTMGAGFFFSLFFILGLLFTILQLVLGPLIQNGGDE